MQRAKVDSSAPNRNPNPNPNPEPLTLTPNPNPNPNLNPNPTPYPNPNPIKVDLVGLVGRADLNGCDGYIEGAMEDKGRYTVKVPRMEDTTYYPLLTT